jgi:hypothetical protein
VLLASLAIATVGPEEDIPFEKPLKTRLTRFKMQKKEKG